MPTEPGELCFGTCPQWDSSPDKLPLCAEALEAHRVCNLEWAILRACRET
jgi:hypothetical protein